MLEGARATAPEIDVRTTSHRPREEPLAQTEPP